SDITLCINGGDATCAGWDGHCPCGMDVASAIGAVSGGLVRVSARPSHVPTRWSIEVARTAFRYRVTPCIVVRSRACKSAAPHPTGGSGSCVNADLRASSPVFCTTGDVTVY